MFETLPAPLAITVVLPEKSLILVSALKTDSAQINQAAAYEYALPPEVPLGAASA